MGAFGGLTLTNKGKILQSKAQTGITLQYTRIAMGDGQLGSTPILALNGLIREKKSLNISKLKIQSGGKAIVGTTWSNNDLSEGFYFREIGVFANDPDEGEILYCYGNSGALAEYIPPGSGSDIIERNLDIVTVVGNALNVTATIDSSLTFASQQDLEVLEQQVIENSNNLTQLQNDFTAHSADYVKHPAVATTTNVGNAYSVTVNPPPISYVDGMGLVITINEDSTGATKINVNGLGAVPIKKANGNDVTNLKANGVYTLRYSSGNFILQGEGGEYGTAKAGDVLAGKTVGTENGLVEGIIPSKAAQTYTPGTVAQTIAAGQFLEGIQTIAGDTDLLANNIRYGKNIFNVAGTLKPMEITAGDTFIVYEYSSSTGAGLGGQGYWHRLILIGTIKMPGTIRIKFTGHMDYSSVTGYISVYKNNSPIGVQRTIDKGGTDLTFTEDFACAVGDVFEIYGYLTNDNGTLRLTSAIASIATDITVLA